MRVLDLRTSWDSFVTTSIYIGPIKVMQWNLCLASGQKDRDKRLVGGGVV